MGLLSKNLRWHMRAIRTTQERRNWDRELGRAKRSFKRLPDSHDDPWRRDIGDRAWKRLRRTQYKPVAMA